MASFKPDRTAFLR